VTGAGDQVEEAARSGAEDPQSGETVEVLDPKRGDAEGELSPGLVGDEDPVAGSPATPSPGARIGRVDGGAAVPLPG